MNEITYFCHSKHRFTILIVLFLCFTFRLQGQPLGGTDELGRTLLQNDSVGNQKTNKQIALFYFLWLGGNTAQNYYDLGEIVKNHPEVLNDVDSKFWGSPVNTPIQPGYSSDGKKDYYFWGKPIYDYYRSDDYWVALKNIQLLTDAGVDLLVIDATNGNTFPVAALILMKAIETVLEQGKNPPRIAFYTNTSSGETMQQAYNNFYNLNSMSFS